MLWIRHAPKHRLLLTTMLALGAAACAKHHAPNESAANVHTSTSAASDVAAPSSAPQSAGADRSVTGAAQNHVVTARESTSSGSTERNGAEHAVPSDAADTDVERDREAKGTTAREQGTSERDRRITQRIREAVVANEELSFTAKNVQIITSNGRVTLRGPVRSGRERLAINAAATHVAGEGQVDDQLEVTH